MPLAFEKLEKLLEGRATRGEQRSLEVLQRSGAVIKKNGRDFINFSSNDYLNLSKNKLIQIAGQSACAQYGSAASASRLVTGNFAIHEQLETSLREFKGYEEALLFSSGYLANIGLLSSLIGRGDYVFIDQLAHASLVDGLLLSRAKFSRFLHNDMDSLEKLLLRESSRRKSGSTFFVICESLYSMDGDIAPLPPLSELAEKYAATLIVDDAHAFGVFGKEGSGLISSSNLGTKVEICTTTLSKAFASYGGVVFAPQIVRQYLINFSRPLIYNTALPPPIIGAAITALETIRKNKGLGNELLSRASFFRGLLQEAGLNILGDSSQIVPLVVGDSEMAVKFEAALSQAGILAKAIRPPTVPKGSARVRFSVTLGHSAAMLSEASEIIIRTAKNFNLLK